MINEYMMIIIIIIIKTEVVYRQGQNDRVISM